MQSVKIGSKGTLPMVDRTQQKKTNRLKSVEISRCEFKNLLVSYPH